MLTPITCSAGVLLEAGTASRYRSSTLTGPGICYFTASTSVINRVAAVYVVEQCGIRNLKYHDYGRQIEVLYRAVAQGNFFASLSTRRTSLSAMAPAGAAFCPAACAAGVRSVGHAAAAANRVAIKQMLSFIPRFI